LFRNLYTKTKHCLQRVAICGRLQVCRVMGGWLQIFDIPHFVKNIVEFVTFSRVSRKHEVVAAYKKKLGTVCSVLLRHVQKIVLTKIRTIERRNACVFKTRYKWRIDIIDDRSGEHHRVVRCVNNTEPQISIVSGVAGVDGGKYFCI